MKEYSYLKDQYPEYVSMDQFYRICRIAKRSALYLVQNGIVPAIDTGKQTWRYQIAIDDVISYLEVREQSGSMIPAGAVSSRQTQTISTYRQIVPAGMEKEIPRYFRYLYAEYADVLTAADIADMTGLNISTIIKRLKAGKIKSLASRPKYLVPKEFLYEFVATPGFLEAKTSAETFQKIIGGFEIWLATSLQ